LLSWSLVGTSRKLENCMAERRKHSKSGERRSSRVTGVGGIGEGAHILDLLHSENTANLKYNSQFLLTSTIRICRWLQIKPLRVSLRDISQSTFQWCNPTNIINIVNFITTISTTTTTTTTDKYN
jgi:hypothetical protein